MRRAYQSDLSDAEWEVLKPHLPVPQAPGRPRLHPLREEIVDAVFFYVLGGGCAWRLLPHDLERPGRPSTITTASSGDSMVGGSGCTRRHSAAGHEEYASGGTLTPAPPSSIPRASKPQGDRRERARLRSRQEGQGKKERHLLVDTQGLW